MGILKKKHRLKTSLIISLVVTTFTITPSPSWAYIVNPDEPVISIETQTYTVPDVPFVLPPRGEYGVIQLNGWDGGFYEGDMVEYAKTFIGKVNYVPEASDPNIGFDCSGFIKYLYKSAFDIDLPHSADAQAALGKVIPKSKAKVGDWVWYPNLHIALYAGNGMMVDAPHIGKKVQERDVWGDPLYVRFKPKA